MLNIPCGCDARREIMFTQGDLGKTEMVIMTVAIAAVLIAWRVGR